MKLYSLLLLLSFSFCNALAQTKPQEPAEPFPYESEDVSFLNELDSLTFKGTFTHPTDGTEFPTVLLISGSGPQDRNSELLGHKSFLVISDYLTKQGIAVLRVDDRGTGESEGDYMSASLNDFKSDAEAAIEYLKTRKEVNLDQIGIIGHSLGGTLAPMIASEREDISFIILMAGNGMPGDELMLLQKEKIELSMGIPEAAVNLSVGIMKGVYDMVKDEKYAEDMTLLETDLKSYFYKTYGPALHESQINAMASSMCMPWFVDFIKHDPATVLKKTTCPVLSVIGEKDLQVPPEENITAIESALKEGGNTSITSRLIPDANHLFQTCETGLPNEYATLEETFSESVMGLMSSWILDIFKTE